jgi:uncharacterized membrane protein
MFRLRTAAAAAFLLCCAFALTGPWRIGELTIRSWQPVLGICLVALLSTLTSPATRELLARDIRLRRPFIAPAFTFAALLLLRIVVLRFHALEINAWDFSISFDRPIEQTLHGNLLWSDTLRMSMLGIHANWLMLAFVPLYALVASPYWLIAGQVVAFAGAAFVLFLYGRQILGDDVAALLIAAAFLCNRYTVRAVNHGFVIDDFYPLAFVLLLYAFRRSNAALAALAVVLILSIKEDAIATLAGIAVMIAIRHRAWRWASAILAAAVLVFAIDYFLVMPAFRDTPMPFAYYWGSFGATPLAAAIGMLSDPIRLLRRVVPSTLQLLASLGLAPLFGGDWILAAAPALLIYTSADTEDLRWLALHYSLPILGVLFAAVMDAVARVGTRDRRRAVALFVLVCSLSIGSSYKMSEPRPERAAIPRLLAAAGRGPVYVQGALFPHVGYALRYRVLHHDVVPPPDASFLLCSTCNPYPFSREELAARFVSLRDRGRFREQRAGDLFLFAPK